MHHKPLQISVSLPQEYAPFTSPILTASPLSNSRDSTLSLKSEEKSQKVRFPSAYILLNMTFELQVCDETTFPFLPLPRDFDCIRFESWAPVAGQIQEWLINIVANPRSQEWIWGRDLFWIAFMAAYPHFPQGSWPVWNSKISMEGAFIQSWIERGFQNWGDTEDSVVFEVLQQLWDEFNRVASLFYDDQLVEASISSYN
jgi:hypothetical protein